MNEKTDTQPTTKSSEFSPTFIRVLITTTMAVLLVIFGPRSLNLNDRATRSSIIAPAPLIASGITVQYAIEEFQGVELKQVPVRTKFLLLAVLVLDFVLIPGCFLFLWRNTFIKKSQNGDNSGSTFRERGSKFLLIFSGVLLVYVCLINAGYAISAPAIFKVMLQDNTIDQNRSRVIADLDEIAFKANQYYHLPAKMGGGGHSFRSHLDPSRKSWLTLSELGVSEATEGGSYSVKAFKNDTLLILFGKGKARLSDGTFPEYEFRVSPSNGVPTKIN